MNTTASPFCLDHLSNDDLLAGTRVQVGRANQALAGLLAHLAEVDARGLYRVRACSSLNTYCVYELRMSEDAAQRRVQAAKIARRFPVLFEQIAAGQIHLTAVLMLGPHLTEAIHLRALRLLVADLKKRKYAVTERSRSASGSARSKERSAPARIEANEQASEGSQHRRSRKRAAEQAKAGPRFTPAAGELGTRTIPAAVRRAVAERDQYRCTYVDDRGHRCRETSGLELHHEHAYALGGPPTTANIALRCRAHNALAAEQDYGREFMASKMARAPAPARSS